MSNSLIDGKMLWAGFVDGKLDYNLLNGFSLLAPALFKTKRDAQAMYSDVRKVKLVEVKR